MTTEGGKGAPCGKCNALVKQKGIQCDVCLTWHHVVCAELPETLYKEINKHTGGGIRWLCERCDEKVGNILGGIVKLRENHEKMEKEMGELKKEVAELTKELKQEKKGLKERQDKVEAEFEGVRKEVVEVGKDLKEQKGKYSEALKKGLNQEQVEADKGRKEVGNSANQEREFQMHLAEAMERDKRKSNLVIMGMKEEMGEQEANQFITTMLSKLLDGEKVAFENKGRVGKEGDKCRPVRVTIEETTCRRGIMKKAMKLKEEREYEKIFISPDLTRKQQEEDKKLRDKVKELRGQGMTGLKINRGCVVKMEGNKREILFGPTLADK
jgi:hypothetical protein